MGMLCVSCTAGDAAGWREMRAGGGGRAGGRVEKAKVLICKGVFVLHSHGTVLRWGVCSPRGGGGGEHGAHVHVKVDADVVEVQVHAHVVGVHVVHVEEIV